MLREWGDGNADALEGLMPLVYDELRKQAGRFLRKERPGHTLQTTALIHETYLKLVDQREANWASRTHFFAISARLMRRILIDHARHQTRQKRGGVAVAVELDQAMSVPADPVDAVDALDLDRALTKLEALDPDQARIIELRFFGGLTIEETAAALSVSPATIKREWTLAKGWLFRELTGTT